MKRIVFIRHAQSQENVKFASLCHCITELKNFRLPNVSQMYNACQLLLLQQNSTISPLGHQQIQDLNQFMHNISFWNDFNPTILLYSNLIRTEITLNGILSNCDIIQSNDIKTKLSCLNELLYYEYIFPKTVYDRQKSFKQYLDSLSHDRVVVVGHGRYIKMLLNMDTELRNCDMVEIIYHPSTNPNSVGSFDTSTFKLIYRTPLSTPSAVEMLSETIIIEPIQANERTDGDEIICRICQVVVGIITFHAVRSTCDQHHFTYSERR